MRHLPEEPDIYLLRVLVRREVSDYEESPGVGQYHRLISHNRGKIAMPDDPTDEMTDVVGESLFPEDWNVGKQAQHAGSEIPFQTEYEIAYGQYKRLIALGRKE